MGLTEEQRKAIVTNLMKQRREFRNEETIEDAIVTGTVKTARINRMPGQLYKERLEIALDTSGGTQVLRYDLPGLQPPPKISVGDYIEGCLHGTGLTGFTVKYSNGFERSYGQKPKKEFSF